MNNIKRVGILLAVAALTIIVSVSYKGNDVLKRAIVLGVGVDVAEEGVCVTAEIVNPGNGGEQVGTFSKTVSAKGKTVAEAFQFISEKTGKETSLGQCVLLVYGEEFAKQNFTSAAEYFARSDSFKESSIVCCCKGTAKDLLNCGDALLQSVSISVAEKLKGQSKEVAVPACDLLTFARSQTELYKTGFLNYVSYQISSNESTENPNQKQVFFDYSQIAVFKQNQMLCVLSQEEGLGFSVLLKRTAGNVFSVTDSKGNVVTLRSNTKNVDVSPQGNDIKIDVKIFVTLARTDSFGAGGKYAAKSAKQVDEISIAQAKRQATSWAQAFLQKQMQEDFDLLFFHETFRRLQGDVPEVRNLQMKDIAVRLTLSVEEN